MTKDTELTIDNLKVTVSGWMKASVGDYTVYEDKVWYIAGAQGCNKTRRQLLEREEHKERKWIGNTYLLKVLEPTGYIKI